MSADERGDAGTAERSMPKSKASREENKGWKPKRTAYDFTEQWRKGANYTNDQIARSLNAGSEASGRSVLSGTGNDALPGNGRGAKGTGPVSSGQSGAQARRGGDQGKGRGNPEYAALISTLENLDQQADKGKASREEKETTQANPSALPPSLSAALEALGALGDTPAGRRAKTAADAAAQAFRYAREAAQRSDEAAYATALGVLRHSARELTGLAASGALPEDAARAANLVAAGIKTLPGKAFQGALSGEEHIIPEEERREDK